MSLVWAHFVSCRYRLGALLLRTYLFKHVAKRITNSLCGRSRPSRRGCANPAAASESALFWLNTELRKSINDVADTGVMVHFPLTSTRFPTKYFARNRLKQGPCQFI